MRGVKILAATGLAIVAAVAFSVSSASAQVPHSADCSFTGLPGIATADASHSPHTGGVESVQQDASLAEHGDNLILDFDHGSFEFGGTGTCVVYEGLPGEPRVANLTISSRGTYANQICGTGSLDSPVGSAAISGLLNDVTYHIEFIATHGVLRGTADHNLDDNPGSLSGVVSITPITGSCAGGTGPTSGVTRFTVAGDVTFVENP
jgi:hypothetical protein